jgi:hypothetical protein
MAVPSFDCTHAVHFDLPRGAVHAKGDPEAQVLVPATALESLLRDVPAIIAERFGAALGAAVGRRVAARLTDAETASVEGFVTQLAGEAALAGLGSLAVERWGRALVFVVSGSPVADSVMVPFLASAIEAACGIRPVCLWLVGHDRTSRIFVGSQAGVDRVREWMASGLPWADAIARLNQGAS